MAAVGLFLTLFLPWYQETVFANGVTTLRSASSSLTGWGAFSFVEAAVLLVSAAVLVLLFFRAEGQAFHVPGGDGGVVTAAGFWTCVLIVWRIFDKQGTTRHGQIAYTSGIEWGIFVALGVAAVLTYAGSQIRRAREPEPPLPGETPVQRPPARPRRPGWLRKGTDESRRRTSAQRTYPGPDMGADDGWTQELAPRRATPAAPSGPAREAPTRREPAGASEAPTRREPADASEAPTRRVRPRSIGGAEDNRTLDRREIQELDIAEPPTARLERAKPAEPPTRPSEPTDRGDPEPGHRRPDPNDDQLTIRLDRGD